MWTVEGQLEQMGRFARRLQTTPGWRGTVGKLLFAWPLLWALVFGAAWVLVRLWGLL